MEILGTLFTLVLIYIFAVRPVIDYWQEREEKLVKRTLAEERARVQSLSAKPGLPPTA